MAAGGIEIDLISREKLAEMTPEQRVRFIVDEIKAGKVLVLERGLTAKEELELIRVTMAEIDHESFIGVETPGFSIDLKKQGLFSKLLGRKPPPRMMVVGPADLLQTIKKDGEMVQAMIVTKEAMGEITMDQLPPPPKDWHPAPPPPAAGETPREEGEIPEEPTVGDEGAPVADGEQDPTEEAPVDSTQAAKGEEEPVSGDSDEAEGVGGTEEQPESGEEAVEKEPEAEKAAEEEPSGEATTEEPKEEETIEGETPPQEENPAANNSKSKQKKKYVSLSEYPEEPEEGGEETPGEGGTEEPKKEEEEAKEEKKEGEA